MRIRTLVATATALTALVTLTACEDDGGAPASAGDIASVGGLGGGSGSGNDGNGSGGTGVKGLGFKGLVKAGSMADAARLINGYTKCDRVSPAKSGSSDSDDPKVNPDAKYDSKTYSVTERGYCGRRNVTAIFMIKDPKVFQAAVKAEADKDHAAGKTGNIYSGPIIGQDFATGSESSDAMSALLAPQSGMLVLNCHPGFNPPSGFRKEPALVKGCFLTDYYKD